MFRRASWSMGRWLPVAVCLSGAIPLATRSARAQSTAVSDQRRLAARELAQRGFAAYERGDYEGALELTRRAYRIVPAPSILIQIARAEQKAGRWVEAAEAYRHTSQTKLDSTSPDAYRTAVLDAEDELAALEPRIPQLRILLKPASAASAIERVTADGVSVPAALVGVLAPVNPGHHEIRVVMADGASVVQVVDIREGEAKDAVLTLAETPGTTEPTTPQPNPIVAPPRVAPQRATSARTSNTARTLGYVGLGLGATGLGVGLVTGLMAVSRHDDVDQDCPSGRCESGSAGAAALADFRSLRTISTIGYVSGAVFVGAGASILLFAPRSTHGGVSVGVSPTGASVSGRF